MVGKEFKVQWALHLQARAAMWRGIQMARAEAKRVEAARAKAKATGTRTTTSGLVIHSDNAPAK